MSKTYIGKTDLVVTKHKSSGRPCVRLKYRDNDTGKVTYPTKYLKGKMNSDEMYESLQELKQELFGATVTPELAAERPDDEYNYDIREIFKSYWNHKCKQKNYDRDNHSKYDPAIKSYFGFLKNVGNILLRVAHQRAADFTLMDFKKMREIEIDMTGHSRKHINEKMNKIKAIFKHARECGMIPASTYADLSILSNLGDEDQHVKGPGKFYVPTEEEVDAFIDVACPFMRTVLIVAANTAVRPQNICNMRWEDIDESGEETDGTWCYKPVRHKTQKHLNLHIYFGKKVITALKNFRDMSPRPKSGFVFSNRVLKAWNNLNALEKKEIDPATELGYLLKSGVLHSFELREKLPGLQLGALVRRLRNRGWEINSKAYRRRHTMECERGYIWHRESHETEYELIEDGADCYADDDSTWDSEYKKLDKNKRVLDQFSNTNYNTELKLIRERVKHELGMEVERFTPHKLRHFYTKKIVEEHGFDAAQAIVGHISQEMTQHYSGHKQDVALAKKIQKQMG